MVGDELRRNERELADSKIMALVDMFVMDWT
jgi:hypothetical protein